MSDDDIDLERVVSDPDYRREVIAYLKSMEAVSAEAPGASSRPADQPRP